jgi:hypothetical protein
MTIIQRTSKQKPPELQYRKKTIYNLQTGKAMSEPEIRDLANDIIQNLTPDNPPSENYKNQILRKHYKKIDHFKPQQLLRYHCNYCKKQILIDYNPTIPAQIQYTIDHLRSHLPDN